MAATWAARVVNTLIELRADGYSFDRAWSMAQRQHPPRGKDDAAPSVPNLFDEDGRAIDGVVSFFRRACENAWHDVRGPAESGNGPAIRHFRLEMVREVDDASPALRSTSSHGRYRMAA